MILRVYTLMGFFNRFMTPKVTPIKRRKAIPKAVREQIWLRDFGKEFEGKCSTPWCSNIITAWDFQAGHNIPDSKGGSINPSNLVPICSRCNLSMSNKFTFDEWAAMGSYIKVSKARPLPKDVPLKKPWYCCF